MKKHILIALSLVGVMITGQAYPSEPAMAIDPNWQEEQNFRARMRQQQQFKENQPVTEKEEQRRNPGHIMGVDYNWLEQKKRELEGQKDHRYDIKDRVE